MPATSTRLSGSDVGIAGKGSMGVRELSTRRWGDLGGPSLSAVILGSPLLRRSRGSMAQQARRAGCFAASPQHVLSSSAGGGMDPRDRPSADPRMTAWMVDRKKPRTGQPCTCCGHPGRLLGALDLDRRSTFGDDSVGAGRL